MKTMLKSPLFRLLHGVCVALVGVLLGAPALAEAPDVQGARAIIALPPQKLVELRRDVALARATDPKPFVAVSDIVARAHEAAMRARGRKAPTARDIARLGPNAVLPALEMLAIDPPHGIPEDSALVVRRDLVEAIGLLRDTRGLSILSTIVESETEEPETLRTAAEALARIGTDEAANKLVSTLRGANVDRARAIVAGMGECRRLRVTEAIAGHLRATSDEATARVAARAIGRAGNAWAWHTAKDHAEEASVRETAARALVDAYVRQQGEAREAASNALMVVDAPQTPAIIAAAKAGVGAETGKALDGLAARFARNPSRVR